MTTLTQEQIKKNLGEWAANQVQEGMLIGLGTGTTAHCFIEALIERSKRGLKFSAVASSKRSLELAAAGGLSIYSDQDLLELDLTIDGADEIDARHQMIKGGGGALAREKILASSSKKMIVLVDETKLVSKLGKFGLPVEILPFCYQTTVAKIRGEGFEGTMRTQKDGSLFLTDNGNYIYDIHSPQFFPTPKETHLLLSALTGVVETGFFFNLPVELVVGYKDGRVVR